MEVHHHTHTESPPAGRTGKKWKHYFWEFLMLFLAVFAGFLAENQREHFVEKQREKQYIVSFAEDLVADTTEINARINDCDQYINAADSLTLLLESPDPNKSANNIYYFLRYVHRSRPFTVNDRTIVQLRNAGGMRLVSDKAVSDSMLSYYRAVDFLKWIFEEQIDLKRSLRALYSDLLYGKDFAKVTDDQNRMVRTNEILKLRPANEEVINSFILLLENIKGINQGTKRRLYELKTQANTIRNFINKEYNLK